MRVLITDDSMVVRRAIQRLLVDGRIETMDHARNGLEAVSLFRKHQHPVVTLDITMPEMDGLQTVDALVSMNPEVKILIISALADKATAIDAIKRGASGFICKPFTQLDLLEYFNELLSA
jgi:two-component system chemotaxis response regulator CheY